MKYSDYDYYLSWAEINLEALDYNLKQLKVLIKDKVKILATVKANAYGHGIVKISKFLEEKIDFLGVASVNEAIKLKKEGIKTAILILGNTLSEGLPLIVDYDLIQTITCEDTAFILDKLAGEKNKIIKVHVKIDTGMGRIGFWHADALKIVKKINKLKHIEIQGLFTHLSSVEKDREFTKEQLRRFNKLIKEIENEGMKIPLYHAANSIATLQYKDSHFNLVRPGLILYGIYPDINSKRTLNVEPILSLKSKVVYLKEVEPGRSISYGRTYITDKKTMIATLAIGYADGYTHLLSHKAYILIKGRKVPVVGRICMDQIMVDVTDIKDVKIGDEAVLIGSQGSKTLPSSELGRSIPVDKKITVEELAKSAGTIPYEIVCWISERVKRVYI